MAGAESVRRMGRELPLGNDPASIRLRVEALEKMLERGFTIPGTKQPVGLDTIIGLVPVAGDIITAVLGLYLVWEARNLGVSKFRIARMLANVGFDTAVGVIPVAGDLCDFMFRSNSRNLKMIRQHLDKHHPHTRIIEG